MNTATETTATETTATETTATQINALEEQVRHYKDLAEYFRTIAKTSMMNNEKLEAKIAELESKLSR